MLLVLETMVCISLTCSQSGALMVKAVHRVCLIGCPSCWIEVMEPKSSSAKLIKRLIGCISDQSLFGSRARVRHTVHKS